jgi:hypothetical protein
MLGFQNNSRYKVVVVVVVVVVVKKTKEYSDTSANKDNSFRNYIR